MHRSCRAPDPRTILLYSTLLYSALLYSTLATSQFTAFTYLYHRWNDSVSSKQKYTKETLHCRHFAPYKFHTEFDVRVTAHRDKFLILNQLDAVISQIYLRDKTLHVSDSSSVHHQEFCTVHTAMVYVIQVC